MRVLPKGMSVRAMRGELGLSERAFAAECGISRGTLRAIEASEYVQKRKFDKVASFLEVSPRHLALFEYGTSRELGSSYVIPRSTVA